MTWLRFLLRLTSGAGAVALALAASNSGAADYPVRPVTLIAPTVAGGAIDAGARLLAERLAQKFGQRVIVENRPGGNGVIGATLAARALPDGHTLLYSSNTAFSTVPHLLKTMPYDPLTDLLPVTETGRIQLILVAHPSMKVATVKEFIAAAKAAPGRIQYASGGEGSDHHLAMEMLCAAAGIRLAHVPYKAGPQGFADLLGGHIMTMFIAPGTAVRHVAEGRVVALGVSSTRSFSGFENVPAVSATVPGYEYEAWFGIFAPRGTPADIVARLNAEIRTVIATPEIAQKMHSIGIVPRTGTPEELTALMKADYLKIGALLKDIGIKPQ